MKRNNTIPKGSINALTGLRFFAAIYVLVFHSGYSFALNNNAPFFVSNFLSHGYFGVSLFFILSGFILAYNYDTTIFNTSSLIKYFKSRFARIYPVYIFALLISLPSVYYKIDIYEVFRVLTMTQSWTLPESSLGYSWLFQAWTLSIELFFYIMFPFFVLCLNKFNFYGILLLTMVVSFLIVYFRVPQVTPEQKYLILDTYSCPLPVIRCIEFLFGILLCKLRDYTTSTTLFKIKSLLVLNILIIVSIFTFSTNNFVLSVASIFIGLLIVQISLVDSGITKFLGSKNLIILGGASFSIYMLQTPVRIFSSLVFPDLLDRFLNPILLIALSILVFKFYEEPMRKKILK